MNPTIDTWDDPVVAAHGHDLHGPYLRDAWLPVVGPTGAWCLPILDTHRGQPLDVHEQCCAECWPDLAEAWGIDL